DQKYDIKCDANQLDCKRQHNSPRSDHSLKDHRTQNVKYKYSQDDPQHTLRLVQDYHLNIIEKWPDKVFREKEYRDGNNHGNSKGEDRSPPYYSQYISIFPRTHRIADHGIDRHREPPEGNAQY